MKPAGEWNQTRIVARGAHVEHWLNGVKVVEYELGSADWKAKVKASKFKDWPNYGKSKRGHIAIQGDHEGALAFRNIRIRDAAMITGAGSPAMMFLQYFIWGVVVRDDGDVPRPDAPLHRRADRARLRRDGDRGARVAVLHRHRRRPVLRDREAAGGAAPRRRRC